MCACVRAARRTWNLTRAPNAPCKRSNREQTIANGKGEKIRAHSQHAALLLCYFWISDTTQHRRLGRSEQNIICIWQIQKASASAPALGCQLEHQFSNESWINWYFMLDEVVSPLLVRVLQPRTHTLSPHAIREDIVQPAEAQHYHTLMRFRCTLIHIDWAHLATAATTTTERSMERSNSHTRPSARHPIIFCFNSYNEHLFIPFGSSLHIFAVYERERKKQK